MMRAAFLVALLFARLSEAGADERRLAVIVSPTSTLTNISAGDLRRTYLGSITRWPSGHRIVPVVMGPESWEQRTFLKRIVQMTDIDYAQHWIGEVFRGRASRPPHVAASAADAVRFVAGHPHAIAIIDAAALGSMRTDGSVRALTVDGKAAGESGDPLNSSPVH
jgi:hypothetical protein